MKEQNLLPKQRKGIRNDEFFVGMWDYNIKSLKEFLENQKVTKK